MKKYSKFLILLSLAIMTLCLFAGCGMSDDEFFQEGDAMVILIGNHANAHRPTDEELSVLLDKKLERCITRYKDGEEYCLKANVSILVVDGSPDMMKVAFDGEEVELKASALSIEKVMREQEYIISDIKAFLRSDDLRANDEEVDLLAAVAEAKIILDQYTAKDIEKHIVIYDSGITTDGFFNITRSTSRTAL